MNKSLLFSASLMLAAGVTANAWAGQPADDAKLHFQAIASGDLPLLMRAYADNAQLNWVGGPLDGIYTGSSSIGGTWEKFTKSQGQLKLTIGKLEESANPKGATVTANVLFEGKQPIKVRYVLNYRDNKIVGETWQIDPQLAVNAY
ncbi:MAG TPA: nuclear transport factor 2 family protein [Noviherbaspirillum sp.]